MAAEQEEEQQVRRQRQEQIQARQICLARHASSICLHGFRSQRDSASLSVRSPPPPLSQMARATQENVVERERAIKQIEVRWCPHTHQHHLLPTTWSHPLPPGRRR